LAEQRDLAVRRVLWVQLALLGARERQVQSVLLVHRDNPVRLGQLEQLAQLDLPDHPDLPE